ncbi:hypothetical protein GGR54DRAFT_647268 [Hypoxylon sp. NC1633]|nr:hypothetical protein GGR54DRAFT_647268 [Hypoxylon sp. NC1633]
MTGAGRPSAPMLDGVNWFLTTFAGMFLGLRVYCKFSRHRGLWWDDYILIFAWVCLAVAVCFITASVAYGFADPGGAQSPEVILRLQIQGGIQNVLCGLALAMSKTSFGVTLMRVTEGRMKMIVLFLIISMNMSVFFYIIFTFVKCQPQIFSWIKGPGCWTIERYVTYAIFAGAYSAFADFCFASIPWFIVMNLQLRTREMIGVAVAMSCGVIAGITAVMRCVYLPLLNLRNHSFQATSLVIWFVAEPAVTIIAASIPVLRALLKEISTNVEQYNRSTGRSGSKSGASGALGGLHVSETVTTVTSCRRDPLDPYGDANSDKDVIYASRARSEISGGIMQTQEVRLSYHNRSDSERGRDLEGGPWPSS